MAAPVTQRVEFDYASDTAFKAWLEQQQPQSADNADLDAYVAQKVRELGGGDSPLVERDLANGYRGATFVRDGKTQQFVGSRDSYASQFVAGVDVVTQYLGVLKDGETFDETEPTRFNMTEWVKLGTGPQSDAYLNAFGRFGLKPYGTIIWSLHDNAIASYFIQNVDGSTFMSGATQD